MEGIYFGTEGIYFSSNQLDDVEIGKDSDAGITSCKQRIRGRPCSLSEEKLAQLMEIYYSKPYSLRRIADILGVSRMTVWRAVQQITI